MEKPADSQFPIHELLRRRWSPRAFSDRAIEAETLRSLLEAARWAPSSYNEQPWSFLVARKENGEEFARMLACLVPANQAWAGDAAVLLLSVAKLRFDHGGKPNRHAFHDVGLASENLVIEATARGLFAHGMSGFDVEKARETFGIPASHEPVAAWALGWAGDPAALDEAARERELAPRTRKPLESFVYSGNWGEAAPLV